MKKIFRKKIFAFFLSALLVLALSLPVFADMGPKPSVTLKLYYTPGQRYAAEAVTQNAHGRHVYLPESMKLLRLRSAEDYDEEILPAGHHYLRCGLDEILLFLRPGRLVPVAKPAANTAALDDTALTLWHYLPEGGHAAYRMYTDDGMTTDYDRPDHWRTLTL